MAGGTLGKPIIELLNCNIRVTVGITLTDEAMLHKRMNTPDCCLSPKSTFFSVAQCECDNLAIWLRKLCLGRLRQGFLVFPTLSFGGCHRLLEEITDRESGPRRQAAQTPMTRLKSREEARTQVGSVRWERNSRWCHGRVYRRCCTSTWKKTITHS